MNADDILKITDDLVQQGSALQTQYNSIDRMYFMDTAEMGSIQRPVSDPDDVKLTISPSVRNTVVGLVRLLTTNEPRFKAKSNSGAGKLDEIEKLCAQMWRESCEAKQADLHVDLVRSAALYSDTHLSADSVDDLTTVAGDDEKVRLTDLGTRTPYLFEVRSPLEDYLYYGRFGVRGILRRYSTRGDDVKATYKTNMQIGDTEQIFVRDWLDMTDRMVWIEGRQAEPLLPATPHNLKELLFAAQIADGSELWREADKRRSPFLYAMWKGNLWRRQSQVLTEIFTAINERGTGVLVGFDEEPGEIKVRFAGPGLRYITAPKPRVLGDTAYDPALVDLLGRVLDPITESSTIFPQTLGSSEGIGDAPFSSVALLSQSGQLPTVPIKKSVVNVIKKVMLAALRRIKSNPPKSGLKGIVDLKPSDIPDDLNLEVTLEIKLPQDMFKNVQIAETAVQMGLITKEWAQENLLQISDASGMRRQIWFEQSADVLYKQMLSLYAKNLATAGVQPTPGAGPAPTAAPGVQTGPTPPGAEQLAAAMAAGGEQAAGGVTSPGGPQAAAAGGGMIEASQPMAPAGTYPPAGPMGGG